MTDNDVYGGQEVTIIAPYDSTVGATVLAESLPAWLAAGWTVGTPDAPATPQSETQDATSDVAPPADPAATAQQPSAAPKTK